MRRCESRPQPARQSPSALRRRKAAPQADGGPRKFLWAELIAFDNTQPDYGVGEYLSRSRFKSDAVSLLLIESSLFEKHRSGGEDFILPEKACSYMGRPYNSERKRQAWTSRQLKGLVAEINSHGVETYASFFEWGRQEVPGTRNGKDEPYSDFFIRQTCAFLRDYGFTGLHAADGYAHPRLDLAMRKLPPARRFEEAAKWGAFWKKAGAAFRKAGFKTYLNTAWKRDPYEAVVRFGYDYRPVSESEIDGWVVESTSAVDELEGWNKTAESSLDKVSAMMVRLAPALRGKEAVLLFGIKDDLEQYNALYHAPTMAEAEAFAAGMVTVDSRRMLSGVMACLSDGLSADEWRKLDSLWRKSFSGKPAKPIGARVVWSERAFEREINEMPELGMASSSTLLAGLIHHGAVVGGAISLEAALADESLPLLVLNPATFPPEELAALERRGADKVVKFGRGVDEFTDHPVSEPPKNWLFPMVESRPPHAAYARARDRVNALSPVVPSPSNPDLVVTGVENEDGSLQIVARSNRPTYLTAEILVDRPVGKVEILSGYPSVPVKPGRSLRAKIPPSGAVALRLSFD